MSIMLSSGGIVSLIVPLLSAYMLTTIGWRISFIILGGIGILITFSTGHSSNCLRIVKEEVKQVGR